MFRMDSLVRCTRLCAVFAALLVLSPLAVEAQQSAAAPAATPAAAPAATPAATPVAPAASAAAAEEEVPFQIPPGWRPKTVKGEELYCKKTAVTGSRFGTDVCMTLSQLEQHERNNAEMRDRMRQSFRVCSGGSPCTNN
jgi:hypothetical protein